MIQLSSDSNSFMLTFCYANSLVEHTNTVFFFFKLIYRYDIGIMDSSTILYVLLSPSQQVNLSSYKHNETIFQWLL